MGKLECAESDDGRLSADLAAMLEPELQDALDHPVRREILRGLNGRGRARTPAELAARLAPLSLSQINYHLQVLAGGGAIVGSGGDGGGAPYLSDVSDKPQVIAVLQATERADRERRRAASAAGSDMSAEGVGR